MSPQCRTRCRRPSFFKRTSFRATGVPSPLAVTVLQLEGRAPAERACMTWRSARTATARGAAANALTCSTQPPSGSAWSRAPSLRPAALPGSPAPAWDAVAPCCPTAAPKNAAVACPLRRAHSTPSLKSNTRDALECSPPPPLHKRRPPATRSLTRPQSAAPLRRRGRRAGRRGGRRGPRQRPQAAQARLHRRGQQRGRLRAERVPRGAARRREPDEVRLQPARRRQGRARQVVFAGRRKLSDAGHAPSAAAADPLCAVAAAPGRAAREPRPRRAFYPMGTCGRSTGAAAPNNRRKASAAG